MYDKSYSLLDANRMLTGSANLAMKSGELSFGFIGRGLTFICIFDELSY
jgi:hypothetical protein